MRQLVGNQERMSKLQINLGKRIRLLREAAGYSQESFASHANIDRAAYGKLERGEINLTLLSLARIAVALEIDLSTLFAGVELVAEEVAATPRKPRRPKIFSAR